MITYITFSLIFFHILNTQETQDDSMDVQYWAVCGKIGRCNNEVTGGFSYDAPHELYYCSDIQKAGWKKWGGCNVWEQSKMIGEYYADKNFFMAECICNKHDARLCTREEIEGNCAREIGCQFDKQLVWTSVSFDCCIKVTV